MSMEAISDLKHAPHATARSGKRLLLGEGGQVVGFRVLGFRVRGLIG